jgi:hypothetical protein
MTYEFQGRTQARAEADRPGHAARARRSTEPSEARQPIHGFAGLMGLVFLLAGIAGFIPGLTSNYDQLEFAGPDSGAKLVGLFDVSVLHNIVHLLFGVGLIAAARASWARIYLLGGGVAYLGVALYGVLVDHQSDSNFLPINDADTVLHLGLGLAMIALGLLGMRLSRDRAGAPAAAPEAV